MKARHNSFGLAEPIGAHLTPKPDELSEAEFLVRWSPLEAITINSLALFPSNPNDPKFATTGLGPATALNVSQVATGQQQRGNNIYAEATFVCPAYWLASAYTGSGRTAYKYHESFVAAIRSIWGKFVTASNPSISAALASGGVPTTSSAPNPVTKFPAWTASSPQQINLNITGGMPYSAVTLSGATVTQFQEPGLKNAFSVANANTWEGGRGTRCDFWRTIASRVPI
ncbi:hypothetical protein V495_05562 [Pseudogymnoascus sp. VKM F-4514 (FW-929)]|nr:hypothetical protein V495_05562 [Pseudogymnoascus sp. VKM F-4514 (FW-929)]KFY55082.1 hypothetical protein V497_07197 [Pseudogymnoascus sp. VKM F-4516 (FW-969)]